MLPVSPQRSAACRRGIAQAARVPPLVPGDLGEAGTKSPLLGLQALGEGLGS